MVDVTADSGANAIMIDTSILTKVSNICLIDTSARDEMVDINSVMSTNGMALQGILPLADLKFFVDYCHYRGVSANLAGSIESFQSQQLWVLIPELDQVSTRSSASAVAVDPSGANAEGENTRQRKSSNARWFAALPRPSTVACSIYPRPCRVMPRQSRSSRI